MYISELQFYYFKENICLQLFDSLWYCFFVIPQYLWKFHYFLASVFLLTSVKCPDKAQKLMVKEMQHEDTTQRINAVLRYMYSTCNTHLLSYIVCGYERNGQKMSSKFWNGMICSPGLGFYGNLDIKSGQEWKMKQTCSLRYALVSVS